MEEITLYLNQEDPGFAQGFSLLCKYSRNQSMMSYVGRKRDMELLLYELQKLSSLGSLTVNPHHEAQHIRFNRESPVMQTPKAESSQQDIHFQIVEPRKVNRDELPEELQKLYDEITEQYKVQRSQHEKMKQANSDVGRKEFRDEVVSLQKSISQKWQIIDARLQNGEKEESPEAPVVKIHVNSHRAYISKMLAKSTLSAEQKEAVKRKVNELLSLGEILKPETLQKLKEKGL